MRGRGERPASAFSRVRPHALECSARFRARLTRTSKYDDWYRCGYTRHVCPFVRPQHVAAGHMHVGSSRAALRSQALLRARRPSGGARRGVAGAQRRSESECRWRRGVTVLYCAGVTDATAAPRRARTPGTRSGRRWRRRESNNRAAGEGRDPEQAARLERFLTFPATGSGVTVPTGTASQRSSFGWSVSRAQ